MSDEVSFGRWLRERRKALDLTQEALGERVGCAAETIRRFEGNRLRPSRETAQRLAEHLDLSTDERAAFVRAARSQPTSSHAPAATGGEVVERAQPEGDDQRRHNLPVLRQPLLGRERELVDIAALVRRPDVGLVTLTGAGGVGKTRLSLALATVLLDAFADGVFVVELAPLTDPALVAPTIAQTLGVADVPLQPLVETLGAHLRTRQVLLVLDNLEHLLPAASLLMDLLRDAPDLTLVVSSREPLHLREEHVVEVPPLAVPEVHHRPSAERLRANPAVTLFVQRAQAVRADFRLAGDNAAAVAEICRRVDGLPLAIELAAAWIGMLPPPALLARLEHPLALLTGGMRDLPARQQTIRSTIDWSYHLLTPDEQQLFTRLGIFRGGWTLEAAETICGPSDTASTDGPADVLDGLRSLLDKSLVRQDGRSARTPRFMMLETLRVYALEQVAARAETGVLQQRHATYYLRLVEDTLTNDGAEHAAAMDRLEVEHDNLRAALAWSATDTGDRELGLRLAGALKGFWELRGYHREGRAWLERLLVQADHAGVALPVRAEAITALGVLVCKEGDSAYGQELFAQSLVLWEELGDTRQRARVLNNLGGLAADQGDYAAAAARYEQSLVVFRELEDTGGVALVLENVGTLRGYQGNYAAATALLEQSLALRRELEDRWGVAESLVSLADALAKQGNDVRATAVFAESVVLFGELGDRLGVAECLEGLAQVVGGTKRTRDGALHAARLGGAAEALYEAHDAQPSPTLYGLAERHLTAPDEATWLAAWTEGRGMTLKQAVAYVLDEGAGVPT